MTQKDIADATGLSPATISNIYNFVDTGVGSGSIHQWVKFFAFENEKALRFVAWPWWVKKERGETHLTEEPAVIAALATLQRIKPQLTVGDTWGLTNRFEHPAFAGRDEDYWVKTFLEELKHDALLAPRIDPAATPAASSDALRSDSHHRIKPRIDSDVDEDEGPPDAHMAGLPPPSSRRTLI